MSNNVFWSFLFMTLLAGCVKAPLPPAPPSPLPAPTPLLEKTFGEMTLDANGVLIQYKDILLEINPAGRNANLPLDYALLTETTMVLDSYRKSIKIVAPPAGVSALQKSGFTDVKGVSAGQRIYLKKNDGFLFVSQEAPRSYLLEFDNGRNIFVGVAAADPALLRELVYSMRDDGRELHAAILFGDSEKALAENIALLQPHFGFAVSARPLDEKTIRQLLADELFSGSFSVESPGRKIPF